MNTSRPLTTKKLLVAFDPSAPDIVSNDFLVPIVEGDQVALLGLTSGQPSSFGVLVYLGGQVTVNDLFARLVDSGRKIPSVERTLNVLADYLLRLDAFKIGNVVSIESAAEECCGFRLARIADTPRGAARNS